MNCWGPSQLHKFRVWREWGMCRNYPWPCWLWPNNVHPIIKGFKLKYNPLPNNITIFQNFKFQFYIIFCLEWVWIKLGTCENFFWGDMPQAPKLTLHLQWLTLPINLDPLLRNSGSATVYSDPSLSDIILSLAINCTLNCYMLFNHMSWDANNWTWDYFILSSSKRAKLNTPDWTCIQLKTPYL